MHKYQPAWGFLFLHLKKTFPCFQQQPPDASTGFLRLSIFTLGDGLVAGADDIRDLISVAIVINACSTFVEFFADVSKN